MEWEPAVAIEYSYHIRCLDVAAMIEAMTGFDSAAPYRGKYQTKKEGMALIRADGFANSIGVLSVGRQKIKPLLADVGDLVELPDHAPGIVQGRFVWAMGETGRGLVPFEMVKHAWRV